MRQVISGILHGKMAGEDEADNSSKPEGETAENSMSTKAGNTTESKKTSSKVPETSDLDK
jgi:hypothetical protein